MISTTVESNSLFFIQTIGRAIERARSTIMFLDEKLPPSDILMMSDKLSNVLKDIDAAVSLSNATAIQLESSYKDSLNRYASLRNTYIDRINERKGTDVQLNMGAELYDGENFLSDVVITMGSDKYPYSELTNSGISVQQVSNPSQYSVLNIVDRMKNTESGLLSNLKECTMRLLQAMKDNLEKCKIAILNFKRVINSPKFMQEMSTDIMTTECKMYIHILQTSMNSIIKILEDLRLSTSTIFRAYLAIDKNYEIYKEAVDTLTSTALESIIGPGKLYDFV